MMGVLARGGGLGARQGWSWLQSEKGSVLAAGDRPLLGALGREPGRKFSRHRHSRSPTGPAPCHTVPRALPFSTAPVPLQISGQDWLLSLPRQHCSKAGARGRTVCLGVEGRMSPHAPPWFCRGFIHEVPQVGPTLSSHRKWLQPSRMSQRVGARAQTGPSLYQRLALSRSSGHSGRSWAASKPRGQPGLGVKRPTLFAQG